MTKSVDGSPKPKSPRGSHIVHNPTVVEKPSKPTQTQSGTIGGRRL